MKHRFMVWAAAAMLVCASFFAGRKSGSSPRAETVISIDPASFSEVENAKLQIEGLAREYITRVHQFRVALLHEPSGPNAAARRDKAIRSLLERRTEFQETSAEDMVTLELLQTLQGAREHESWLEVYLQFLYANPTSPVLEDLAEQAVQFAELGGNSSRLEKARHFLSLIPEEGAGIEIAQNGAEKSEALTRL